MSGGPEVMEAMEVIVEAHAERNAMDCEARWRQSSHTCSGGRDRLHALHHLRTCAERTAATVHERDATGRGAAGRENRRIRETEACRPSARSALP